MPTPIQDKRFKIFGADTCDEIERVVNDFAQNHSIRHIDVCRGQAPGKKWAVTVTYLQKPDNHTFKIRVITMDGNSLSQLENKANSIAESLAVEEMRLMPLPQSTSDSIRHCLRYMAIVTYHDTH